MEHLTVKDSTAGNYLLDAFRELQRQLLEMKKELKELKGEA